MRDAAYASFEGSETVEEALPDLVHLGVCLGIDADAEVLLKVKHGEDLVPELPVDPGKRRLAQTEIADRAVFKTNYIGQISKDHGVDDIADLSGKGQ